MSQDNPIYRTLTDVLGLGRPPKSFQEKASAIEILTSGKTSSYRDILRSVDTSDIQEGSKVAFGKNIDFMFEKLHKAGLVPEEARNVFERVKSVGGQIGFNEKTNALFLYNQGKATLLPTANKYGGIDIGGRSRKVNSLLIGYAGEPYFEKTSYLSAYYSSAEKLIAESIDSYTGDYPHLALSGALRKIREHSLTVKNIRTPINNLKIGSITLSGTTSRGLQSPLEQRYTSSLNAVIGYSDEGLLFADKLANYRIATSAFSMLSKTGGKSIYQDLKNVTNNQNLTVPEALEAIRQYRKEYFGQALPAFLKHTGLAESYIYGKADFLGNKKKFLVAGKELGNRYGTLIEEHTAKKGLHQMSKMADEQMLKVAVVDLQNEQYSRLLFGEGGAYMTPSGAEKLAFRAPVGTMKITSPDTSVTNAIEELFGVNLSKGDQIVDQIPSFTKADVRAALRGDELTDTQKLIRKVLGPKGYNRGLLLQIAGHQATLNQIKMTPDKIELSFLSGRKVVPETIETVVGGRRSTGGSIERSHLKDMASRLGVDYVIAADEFAKTHGQDVLTTNFIHQLRQHPQGEALLRDTFGNSLVEKIKQTKLTQVPEITDANTAFLQATAKLNEWKKSDNLSLRMLAHRVEYGQEASLPIQGVKGIKIFGMRGGRRSDFMGDINMMKGVRMSLSKMQILANSSRLLGYSSSYDDPVFAGLTSRHSVWSKGLIRIRQGSNQLTLSRNHTMHKFASALLGTPNIDSGATVLRIGKNGLELDGKSLARLPSISAFSHSAGGVHSDLLKDTVLGLDTDLAYLDLGVSRKISILGKEREMRYLPIPLQYLRATPGAHGFTTVGKSHTGYDFLKSLTELESNQGFDPARPLEYTKLVKALAGRDGIFAKTNTLHIKFGTRARISPDTMGAFSKADLLDPNKFYTSVISEEAFKDWYLRKAGVASGPNRSATMDAIRKRGYFYGIVGVDPAQRAEHMMLQKIHVKKSGIASFFGQLNITLNPLFHRSVERDIDRDVVNLISMEGLADQAALEDRFIRQTKKISPFVRYYNRQLEAAGSATSVGRLSKLVDHLVTKPFVKALDYIEDFIGVPKSLGYSMVRASDEIMANITAYGLKGAKQMGVLDRGVPSSVIEQVISKFKDPEKVSVIQQLMQSMYQGAVQKGHGKAGLTGLGEGLINLGQKYRKTNFNLETVEEEASALFEEFLQNEKERAFMALDWMTNQGMLDKKTTDLMLGDLTRASKEELARAEATVIKKTAQLLGSYVGVGAVLSSTVTKQPNTVRSLLQKTVGENTSYDELNSLMRGIVGAAEDKAQNQFGESVLESIEKKQAAQAGSKIIAAKKFATDNKFLMGLGVGAVMGGALVSLMSGPSMPRDIDIRQPEDLAPEPIFSSRPPRVYGTNQGFTSSRRRENLSMPAVSPYRMSTSSSSNITIREKSASNNPYLLERQMREISNSDYTY